MRASNQHYALAIPPGRPSSRPAARRRTPTDGGGQTADAGEPDAGTPTDPCQGFVVPLATRCSSDGTPPYHNYIWSLKATPDHCSLRGEGISFIMTPAMSGATEFTSTSMAGELLTCVQ